MKLMGYKSKVVVVSVFLCVCMLNMECTNEIWWCMMYDDDDNDKFLLLFCFMIWIWIFFHLLLFLFSIIVNNLGVIHFFLFVCFCFSFSASVFFDWSILNFYFQNNINNNNQTYILCRPVFVCFKWNFWIFKFMK